MPRPSYLPVTLALGITLALVGVVVGWLYHVVSVIGGVIAIVALVIWIRQAREEMAELPLDH